MSDIPQEFQASLGGTYKIERSLGGGGMSQVYIALDEALGRRVVVKLLSPRLAGAVNAHRFDREIHLAARLQHPHIVPLLTAGQFEGLPFFTMPYVEGESLKERIERAGPLPIPEVIRICRDVASALEYAHAHGVVHRDIKPANILLSGDAAVVTDFGVAKAITESVAGGTALTSLGAALGTPAYMSPEQAAGESYVDGRADIYALGITAYEMLTGEPPFAGRSLPATVSAHIMQTPDPVSKKRANIAPRLSELVMQCLEKDPADRPQRAADIVRLADEMSSSGSGAVTPSRRSLPFFGTDRIGRRPIMAALTAATLLFGGFGGWWALRGGRSDRGLTGASTPMNSIAVLPFSGSADSTDEYFGDGMAEQLIVTLSSVPGMAVASRTSAFTFKGRKDLSAGEIGRSLHVDNILEGSIRRSGDRLRVFVQLTNARDGSGIWSDNFEARNSDVFAVQDSISRAILDRLRVGLAINSPRHLTGVGTTNPAAYDMYLRARHESNKFEEGALRESIKLYDQALTLDPRYAKAWAGIAESWLFLADDYVAPRIAYPAAMRAADQALSFDSTVAAAHAARGVALSEYQWNLPEGRREVNAALALDPHSFLAQLGLYGLLLANGKPDSALTVLKAAEAADPLSVLNALVLGRFYGIVGRTKEAIGEYQRAMQLSPPLAPIAMIQIGEAMIGEGRLAEADSLFRGARKALGTEMEYLLASGEAARGRRAEALRLVAKYEALARARYVRPELIAAVYVRLGDRDKTFAWLEKGYDARTPYMLTLKVDRQWDPIRDDPRYTELVRRIGLP